MSTNKASERAWANISLLVGLATLLVAIVRVYAWSGFYVPVALSVLGVAERTTLLASTLLLVLLAFVPLMLAELAFSKNFSIRRLYEPRTSPGDAVWGYASVIGLFLVLIGFTPLSTLLTIGGLLAAFAVVWLTIVFVVRVKQGRDAAKKIAGANFASDPKLRAWPIFVALCGSALLGVVAQPWVPLESIVQVDAPTPITGYVVGAQGEFTLVVEEDKSARWIATSSIAERTLCARDPYDMWGRSVPSLFSPVFLQECGDAIESAGSSDISNSRNGPTGR
jgi:hypothetical protein